MCFAPKVLPSIQKMRYHLCLGCSDVVKLRVINLVLFLIMLGINIRGCLKSDEESESDELLK